MHCRNRRCYRCRTYGHTFSERRGTVLEGLRQPTEFIVIVFILLSYGCPVQAIEHTYGLDERTIAHWRDRAGAPCHTIHGALVEWEQAEQLLQRF
ncbi:hypothetical protein [Dictyobacter vulcani]|uniref:hypothetical protein n=1 Tax=Dictyobacter vulcani TaxID=2607529 RepID=UPI00138683C6|nr:hypothetical protein [Dictyobacter vulcani]